MKYYIYCLEFKDGSYYVGQSKDIKVRMGGHRFTKKDEFEYFVLDECDENNALLLECMWIQSFKGWGLTVRNKNPFNDVDTNKRPSRAGGRKPLEDKAIRFIIYPRQSWLDKLGEEEARRLAMEAIETLSKDVNQ